MKSMLSHNDQSPHDDLPIPYRIAVETILAEPTPDIDLARLIPNEPAAKAPHAAQHHWVARVGVWSLAAAAALILMVHWFDLRPSDAWAQVAEAVRKQPWVRLSLAGPDNGNAFEVWLSPAEHVAASRFPGAACFLEFDEHKMQRFDKKENAIYISQPQSHDHDQFAALDAVLQSFGSGEELRQFKAGSVRLVAQSRREGQDGDEHWTEYVLDFEDARRSPPLFRQVFRIPQGADLPERMTEEWIVDGKTGSRTFSIDYPASGPADLFALGVPRDAKVIDTRSDGDLAALLAAYNQQQETLLEPYSATVLVSVPYLDWKDIFEAYRVRRDAEGLHVETVDPGQLVELRRRVWEKDLRIPDDADRIGWWKTEVSKLGFQRRDEFTTGMYCPEQVGYPLIGVPNDRSTLNPRPLVGPSDSVMLTLEGAATGDKKAVYWFAADRGHMIVRSERSSSRDKPSDWIDTIIVDSAEKSPQGRWYPTQVRHGRIEKSGDDLRPDTGVAPVATLVYRFLVEFE